ncbi:hypothetical protein CSA56_02650 [candidate division KSB3 bacterium]|uniref:Uncharacterized protein n=1 Tax=candidate division KSB3 bacterium TaxID=2044937 RepID=A0A2G6KLV6_9BACT|nr:MAG: hypothetical protein CSA56_02650 [candidate division KSB3 bacterium]
MGFPRADGAHDTWTFAEQYIDIQTADVVHAAGDVGPVGQAVLPTDVVFRKLLLCKFTYGSIALP